MTKKNIYRLASLFILISNPVLWQSLLASEALLPQLEKAFARVNRHGGRVGAVRGVAHFTGNSDDRTGWRVKENR